MNYYEILEEENKAQCNQCGRKLSTSNKNNLIRHYKLVHNQEIILTKRRYRSEACIEFEDKLRASKKRVLGGGGEYKQIYRKEIAVPKSPETDDLLTKQSGISDAAAGGITERNEFLKCCLGLVAVTNAPLELFDDEEFFKTLIYPYEEKFNTNLSSQCIVKLLEIASNNVKNIIREKVKNRMISLKIDVATRIERSILLLSIQYINNSRICTSTLGMIKLDDNQKATYLRDQVLKCLEMYDIELSQIYSTTIDNGENVMRFDQILEQLHIEEFEDIGTNEETAARIGEINDNIQKSLTSMFSVAICPAHTIHMAAYDVIKNLQPQIENVIKAVKEIREFICSSGVDEELPVVGKSTQWHSVYEMLISVLNIKSFINSQLSDKLQNSVNWYFASEFVVSFAPLANWTKLLQKEQYVLGDFYRDWLNCEIELEEVSNPTAWKLHTAMQSRKQQLLENEAFVAALYLDPRFNFSNSPLISKQQEAIALEHLVKTFDIMRELDNCRDMSQQPDYASESSSDEQKFKIDLPTTSSSAYAKLEQRIMSFAVNSPKGADAKLTFREKLIKLSNTKMVSFDTDILEYFSATSLNADVRKVLNIALAVPACQFSAERAFSALALSITQLRNNINNITLDDLLVTKFNFAEIKSHNVNLDFISFNL